MGWAPPARACDPSSWDTLAAAPAGASFAGEPSWPAGAAAVLDTSWGAPENLGPAVNAWDQNCEGVISADGTKLYYNYHHSGLGGQSGIYVSTWNGAAWSAPAWTGVTGGMPSLTSDGQKLFYRAQDGLRVSTWSGSAWGASQLLVFDGTAMSGKEAPAVFPNGDRIIFCWGWDLWQSDYIAATGHWGQPQRLGSTVNTQANEWHPFVTYDGQKLYFTRSDLKIGNFGSPDIYYCVWDAALGRWGPAYHVGAPVSFHNTCSVSLPLDESRLYFGGFKEGGYGALDEWSAPRAAVGPGAFAAEAGAFVPGAGAGAFGAGAGAFAPREQASAFAPAAPGSAAADTWTELARLPGASLVLALAEDEAGRLYAGTYPGGDVFVSSDHDVTWTATAELPGAVRAQSLLALPDGSVLAGTVPGARIYRTTDGGASWALSVTPQDSLTTGILALVRGTADTLWAATTGAARLWRSTDGGVTWSPGGEIPQAGIELVLSVLAPAAGRVIAGIFLGPPLWTSSDAGASWSQGSLADRGAGYSLHRAPDGTYYAGVWLHGSTSGVFRSSDGATWTQTAGAIPGTYADLKVLAFADGAAGTLYAGIGTKASGELVFSTTDGGASWASTGALDGAREVLALLRSRDGALYAGTSPNGGVYRLGTPALGVGPEVRGAAVRLRAFPNPAGRAVRFVLSGAAEGRVRVDIHGVDGRRVRRLEGRVVAPGAELVLPWDGLSADGRPAPAGLYFARLEGRAGATTRFAVIH
ncbi:MAG: PD40 domain-containing protein [Candidatus Eisenbacteria bacterium]|nr:PD40 domain-containing protein [Candidatus Eisenbacteria bacterium]